MGLILIDGDLLRTSKGAPLGVSAGDQDNWNLVLQKRGYTICLLSQASSESQIYSQSLYTDNNILYFKK